MSSRIPPISIQGSRTYTDITKWDLPKGAISRLGRGWVQAITFSPDGSHLILCTRLGLWWYKLATMSPVDLWETERGLVSAVDFSTCGRWLATGNWDGIVKVWDVKGCVCISEMEQPRKPQKISQIAFSRGGVLLAASCQREAVVFIWHSKTGEEVTRFTDNTAYRSYRPAIPLTFSPNDCLLACVSPGATPHADLISVWNVSTGERVACFRGHTTQVYALSFSPCGRLLASGDKSGILRVWDIATEGQVWASSEYAQKYRVIPSYTASGELHAAGVNATTITVWDVEKGKKLKTFEHRDTIRAMCFSRGTHLAVASAFDFKVWTADNIHRVSSIPGHTHLPFSLTFSADGEKLISAGSGLATCWDVAKEQPRHIRRAQTCIHSISISPDGSIHALGTQKNTMCVWNVETNETIATLAEQDEYVKRTAFAPTSGLWASADIEGKMYVWDYRGKRAVLIGHTEFIEALVFSPNENRLASASRDKTARVWDVVSGREIALLCLTPLLDTSLYKGDAGEIQRRSNSCSKTVPKQRSIQIQTLAFSPCGNIIAGGLHREIRLWDAKLMTFRCPYFHHSDVIIHLR